MKKILFLFVFSSQVALADCLQELKHNKILLGGAAAVTTGAALHIAVLTSPVGVVIGSSAIAGVFVIKLTNIKRTIRLINEAYAYQKDPKHPGKLLSRIHRKIVKHNPGYTLNELADHVIGGNLNGSLCDDKILSNHIAQVKKDLKSNVVEITDVQDANDVKDEAIDDSEMEKTNPVFEKGEIPNHKNPSIED